MSASTYFKITTTTEFEHPLEELKYFLFSYWDVWSVDLLQSENVPFIDENGDEDYKTKNIFEAIIFELDQDESKSIVEKIKEKAKINGCDIEIKVFYGNLTKEEIIAI